MHLWRSVIGAAMVAASVVLSIQLDDDTPSRAFVQLALVVVASAVASTLLAWGGRVISALVICVVAAAVTAWLGATLLWDEGGEVGRSDSASMASVYAGGLAFVGGLVGSLVALIGARLSRE